MKTETIKIKMEYTDIKDIIEGDKNLEVPVNKLDVSDAMPKT